MSNIVKKILCFTMVFIFAFVYTLLIGKNVKEKQKNNKNDSRVSLTVSEEDLSQKNEMNYDGGVVSLQEISEEIESDENIELSTEILTEENTHEKSQDEDSDIPDESEQPDSLSTYLEMSDIDYEYLRHLSCRQLIIVDGYDSMADISMYELSDDGKWYDTELSCTGYVGSYGVSHDSYEGSYMTPAGLYGVGDAFYIYDRPDTGLDSFEVTDSTYWVDDPESVYYNQLVELAGEPEWNSAEHMIDYIPQYNYGFVINYNMDPIVPGKGSAIFFHVGSDSTAGCVAVSEDMMLSYLKQLSNDMNPYILILE